MRYVINQRGLLLAHVGIPAIPIHHNDTNTDTDTDTDTEQDLRHVMTGRKNWMIYGGPKGGQVAAILF